MNPTKPVITDLDATQQILINQNDNCLIYKISKHYSLTYRQGIHFYSYSQDMCHVGLHV